MHLHAINTSLGKKKSEMKRNENQLTHLEGNCLHLHSGAQLSPPPPLQPPLWMTMDSNRSGDESPETRGLGTPPRIFLQDGGPPRPPSHLSLSH